ncbi:flagella synthesis protein FlgN [Marinimicrobium koreense]|nr:flagellar protein FlgN [Marinimicrobium koreense]
MTEANMTPSAESVSQMLAHDAQAIEELSQVLLQEREALEQRDLDALPPLIDAKNRLMAALGEHALQRQSWLDAATLPHNHEGWQKWLHQRPDTRGQAPQWQELAEHFEACRALNDINGKIIQRSRQTVGTLLDLLRGQSNDGPSLYNAQGRSGPQGGSQTLVKA